MAATLDISWLSSQQRKQNNGGGLATEDEKLALCS